MGEFQSKSSITKAKTLCQMYKPFLAFTRIFSNTSDLAAYQDRDHCNYDSNYCSAEACNDPG